VWQRCASDSTKIYNTANKVFMVSSFHPVGVMAYGSAEMVGNHHQGLSV
jgi:hypothetical protein